MSRGLLALGIGVVIVVVAILPTPINYEKGNMRRREMNEKQTDIRRENLNYRLRDFLSAYFLIQRYRELSESWNGKDLHIEQQMQDVAEELEDLGINVEDLED